MPSRTRSTARLPRLLDRLEASFGVVTAPPLRTVFEHVLWENVAYLADDDKRAAAFAALRKATKLRPEAVLAADLEALVAICATAGPHALQRAGRLQDSARIVLGDLGGDDASVLALPVAAALKQLGAFPAIGKPGAEKILLFLGAAPLLALESNGLRALLRLGYGEAKPSYDASYRSARDAAANELAEDCATRQRAFLLLRELGRRTCKNTRPRCAECPVRADCPSRGVKLAIGPSPSPPCTHSQRSHAVCPASPKESRAPAPRSRAAPSKSTAKRSSSSPRRSRA